MGNRGRILRLPSTNMIPLPFLLLLLIVVMNPAIVVSQEDGRSHEVHCSRERSRAAWKIIELYLMPFIKEEKYNISRNCKLHSHNDMFREQEQHKIFMDYNEWKCGFCKKSFREEKYLDKHFHNRHYNLLDHTEGRCLADLCGSLHCDEVIEPKKPKSKCNPAAAAKNRHLCETLADSCFPVNKGHISSRLHEFFLRQFCDAHTCSIGGRKPFPRGGRKETSILYLATCILIVLLLPLFYVIVWLHQREKTSKGYLDFKRISKMSRKQKAT
ncbi:C2H2-like zinc finger protein [Zostera marina]|uniref:C2H2-like zinc finger protein n=1 Tax=Zostera marina TaxID=29655 RepID=A0A0K9NI83_ZOSMR|nr:C2H2-like zinc finger protein [Zostera marina]